MSTATAESGNRQLPEKSLVNSNVSSVNDGGSHIDPDHSRRVTRKCDLHILPPLFLLWFLSLVDRVNIGSARIQGLERDLGMNPRGIDFNIALVIFFIPYVLFEVPSNMVLKHVRPSRWLALEVFLLGLATMGQGLVKNYGGLVAMRFLVGLFEAGLVPGCVCLLAAYYPRFELQWRLSILMVANALASAFGGLLAYAVAALNGDQGFSGWRWIFIIEGAVTAASALCAHFFICNWPENASFLSTEDYILVRKRIANDAGVARMDDLNAKVIARCVGDWKIWLSVLIYIGTCTTTYAINLFSPTIITQLNPTFTPRETQAHIIPIFLASALFAGLSAYFSDRVRHRYTFVMVGYAISTIGWTVLLCEKLPGVTIGVRYMALYFVGVGSYISLPLLWTLLVNNVHGHYKVAFASGAQIGLGNCGGIVASLIYQSTDAPLYLTGFRVSVGLLAMSAILLTVFVLGLRRENGKRDRGERDWRLREADRDNLGDDHPQFRHVF